MEVVPAAAATAAAAAAAAAAAVAWGMSPVQPAKGFVASLTAIGELGSSDSTPIEQQSKDVAPAGVGCGAASGWVSPVGMVRAYIQSLHCMMTVVAEWDGSDFQLY
jgi:hypothetical protein